MLSCGWLFRDVVCYFAIRYSAFEHIGLRETPAFHADALGLHIAFHMGGGAEGAPLFLRILCRAHPFYEPAAHSPPVQNRSGRLGIGQSALGIFLCPLIFHGQYTSNIDVHCKPLLEKTYVCRNFSSSGITVSLQSSSIGFALRVLSLFMEQKKEPAAPAPRCAVVF